MDNKIIDIYEATTCSYHHYHPSLAALNDVHDQYCNVTISSPVMHHYYINMLLQICSQRNVAQEMWRLFVFLYGLASVFLVSKCVCMIFLIHIKLNTNFLLFNCIEKVVLGFYI